MPEPMVKLRQACAAMPWPVSLALVQEMAALGSSRGWAGDLARFHLRPGGRLELEATGGQRLSDDESSGRSISALAAFLEDLLPAPGEGGFPRVPPGLRYALVRARGGVTAPPIPSLHEFSAMLARFEQGDRRDHLQRLAGSLHPPRASATRWVKLRRYARPLLAAAATLSLVIAGSVATTHHGARPAATLQPAGTAGSRATMRHPAVGSPPAGTDHEQVEQPPERGTEGTVSPREAGGDAKGDIVTQDVPVAGSSASDDARPDAAASASARPSRDALPARLRALHVGSGPVFSPSFAADGSSIFFDQADAAGGSALKEARVEDGSVVVQVGLLVSDGARNYHPQLSPDGALVAFDSDRDGVRGVYLADRTGRRIRRVSGDGYAAVPSWSPDGTRLAFVKAEPAKPRVWNLWMLNLSSGKSVRVTAHRYGQPWGASWFPDGRRICYSHEDRLFVLDLQSGRSRSYDSPRARTLVRTPAVSPEGTRVVFQVHRDGGWMLDLGTGRMRKVLDDPTAEEFSWSPDGARVAFHSRRDRQWGIWVLDL